MTSDERNSLQASVFRNTGRDPMWIGFWMSRFMESEQVNPEDLASKLGISPAQLVILSLCRTPRPDHFQEDLLVVCARTGALLEEVARIIRQEQAVIRWREGASASPAGWLMAASDHQEPSDPGDAESENDHDELR